MKADKNGAAAAKPAGATGDKKKPVLSIPEKKPTPALVQCWSRTPIVIGFGLCS